MNNSESVEQRFDEVISTRSRLREAVASGSGKAAMDASGCIRYP